MTLQHKGHHRFSKILIQINVSAVPMTLKYHIFSAAMLGTHLAVFLFKVFLLA